MKVLLFTLFVIIISLQAQTNSVCLQCHSDPDLTGTNSRGETFSVYVDDKILANSVHAGFDCVDCHQDLQGVEEFPHAEYLKPVDCGSCHSDIAAEYSQTMHGLKFIHLESKAPRCWDCHGKHDILPPDAPLSKVNFRNIHNSCYTCHRNKNLLGADTLLFPVVTLEYLQGVHGKLLMAGDSLAPTCNNCHPAHDIRLQIDPLSTIYKLNIPKTCGKCHFMQLAQFGESIHFTALNHGITAAPACNDCHGEHNIARPDSAFLIASNDACIRCHNDPRLIKEYGLPSKVVSTYEDSYHGRSIILGRRNAATCASCHGSHAINGPENPFSPVNKRNLVKTCSKCHQNVTPSFAESYTHVSMLIGSNPINHYITLIYIIIIAAVIGGMFGHNLVLYLKYVRIRNRQNRLLYITRFTPSEVFQHAVLTVTFTVLAVSGFALAFPNAWWVSIFEHVGIHEYGRGLIHRTAAVCFIIICLYHIYYLVFTPRGRHMFMEIFPRMIDVKQAFHAIGYYVGLRKNKPLYSEFEYTEKAEYWALVWGGVVMALTGIVLWFPTLITGFAPSWVVMASQLVHFYEAILATAAIVVFHIFIVVYHPESYPMNLSWINGKMSLKEAVEEHPEWISRILKEKKDLDLLPEVIRANCETIDDVQAFLHHEEAGTASAEKKK